MPSLVIALVCLVAWFLLTFVRPAGSPAFQLLLAVGTTLLVRWWALRDQRIS